MQDMVTVEVGSAICWGHEMWETEWGQFMVVSADRFEQLELDLIGREDVLTFQSTQVMCAKHGVSEQCKYKSKHHLMVFPITVSFL